ncbi:hypothetical protein C9374_009720 [Naegleria lovaniensis]|uniref:UDENN domain-containing protein n=1 Tax=Naegleria lovaniensis TaxID=51637 RepID=A0AA88KPH9_NAELO|nr:uncharacterized protein C9374_009720 [Naegleria lovaniensis]KAG2393143.1 hypothetical protein C9374_009720 [Naegleria lovaniensis]
MAPNKNAIFPLTASDSSSPAVSPTEDDENTSLLQKKKNRVVATGMEEPSSSRSIYRMKKNDQDVVEKVSTLSVINPMIDTSIVCLFVVKFDLKIGYQVEHQMQNSSNPINLNGIEYKCLPSGTHKLDTDIVLFRHVNDNTEYFGLGCVDIFRSKDLDRGSRIRALGILSRDYRGVMTHMTFLRNCIQGMNACDNTEDGRKYIHHLTEYFQNHDSNSKINQRRLSEITKEEIDNHLNFGSLISLFYFYRENIFTLWKAILLKKRILISTSVPIGSGCSKAHAMHFLTYFAPQQDYTYIESHFGKNINFCYYISLNDYSHLLQMKSYLACTCDEILESKPECYDVLLKDRQVIIPDKTLKQTLKKSESDEEKSKMLDNLLNQIAHLSRIEQEAIFRKYFAFINNQTILFLGNQDKRAQVNKHIMSTERKNGTLPLWGDDIYFVKELAELIGLDIEFTTSRPFCCC